MFPAVLRRARERVSGLSSSSFGVVVAQTQGIHSSAFSLATHDDDGGGGSSKNGECVVLPGNSHNDGHSSSVLVRLAQRGWGAMARLPKHVLYDSGMMVQGKDPNHIAVVRDAFAAHDENPRLLKDSLVMVGPKTVAVAADVLQAQERLVVDQYDYDGHDTYTLKDIGTDLVRYLKMHGLSVKQVSNLKEAAALSESMSTARQSSNEVLMVAPTAFVFNDQAAQDNSFMNTETGEVIQGSVTQQVLKEFSDLYTVLTENARVKVNLFQHCLHHGTPDAVFPNNWFSTHAASEAQGGVGTSTLVYYPMKCPNRQAERRDDIKEILEGMGYGKIVDLSGEEKKGRYFEGTGVLVLDRVRGTAFVALSERADLELAEKWVAELGYNDLVTFHSSDSKGSPVYHTNVMMAVGTSVAVACLESITDDAERKRFVTKLSKTHEIVDISQQQMAALCGNVLELEDDRGLPVMAMSTRAYNAFTLDQKNTLQRHVAGIHHANIDTLEHIGGGGVRCTLAEIFTP